MLGYSLESDGSSHRRRSVLPGANIEWIIGTVIGMDGSPRRRTMLMNAPDITDESGRPHYRVDGKVMSLPNRLVLRPQRT
jgi:hypothetical protein